MIPNCGRAFLMTRKKIVSILYVTPPFSQRIHEVLSLPDRPAGCRIRIGSQNLKGPHQRIVNGHHGTGVVELPTIIGCGKECDEFTPGKEFVSVFNDLMSPNQEIEIKPSQKLPHDVSAVRKGNSPVIFRPTLLFVFARSDTKRNMNE